ncbi:hypothetical protein L6452_40245 [Arctium lappa]|uniref:Uncharacterized protein n=1 Tax=Arctium lappa TaxID=4217 RepID=A0ACB8XLD4_ARCLA|nr:hypothetical protein L6452_40245 [Arctium lappa]
MSSISEEQRSSNLAILDEEVFEPRQVSIGPLHRKNVNLQAFERQKETFLNDLLSNSCLQQREEILETCVKNVNASLGKIKACYGDGIKSYNDDEITRMMVMDSCFILEFIYKSSKRSFDKKMVIEPISMAFDLVLIENQIPFFVLQDIFECTCSRFKPEVTSLNVLIIHKFLPTLLGYFQPDSDLNKVDDRHPNHILGLIHEYYRPISDDAKKCWDAKTYWQADPSEKYSETYYSVVELDRAGVNFKPHHHRQWPMEIKLEFPPWYKLWANPILRMPVLRIQNYTELVFRNLIAYEQLSPCGLLHYVTSYAIAMDLLIDNHEDVARLVKSKVIINTIGSNEEAAKLINDMRKEISCPHFLYTEVWEQMNKYRNRFWPKNIAWLRRRYFSNPWSIIALFAGEEVIVVDMSLGLIVGLTQQMDLYVDLLGFIRFFNHDVETHVFMNQGGIEYATPPGLPLEQTLEACVQKVNASIGRIKACYGNEMEWYNDDDITRMMLMDGCFILEFIYNIFKDSFDENMVIEPISMAVDLVLLENQIPFFVLQDIFECTRSRFKAVASLNELLIYGLVQFLHFIDSEYRTKNIEAHTTHDHILGFIHECYRPSHDVEKDRLSDSFKEIEINPWSSDSYEKIVLERINSAVELDRAGVNFKPHHQPQDRQWPMNIEL